MNAVFIALFWFLGSVAFVLFGVLLPVTALSTLGIINFRAFVRNYLWLVVLFVTFIPIGLIVTLGIKDQRTGNRPFHFFLDMKYQPKYTAQGQSQFFADGRAMRPPVVQTIPFATAQYAGDAGVLTPQDDALAESDEVYRGVTGPDKLDTATNQPIKQFVEFVPKPVVERFGGYAKLLEVGKEKYNINCMVCHGQAGNGAGIIQKYGKDWGLNPASYHQERLRNPTPEVKDTWSDGHIFNVITNGKNTMMGYGHQIKVMDRWAIVAYVRALQFSQIAQLKDIPESERPKLEKK
jgi:hypothetical protein